MDFLFVAAALFLIGSAVGAYAVAAFGGRIAEDARAEWQAARKEFIEITNEARNAVREARRYAV